jgi:uroporphyrinogen-III decarboxylase
MHGAMLDMYRQPDKLLEACDRILQGTLERIATAAAEEKSSKTRLLFMGMHRGSDGFMSLKQFETFYWPALKEIIIAVADSGLVPCLFYEGNWTTRLEYLLELPPGKTVARLDLTDIFKAKQILNGHTCIMGNVPPSLLRAGTPEEVKDYCKKLIDVVGKGGGYIMAAGSSIDEVNPENLKTMVDFTKEYGIYS